MKTVLILAACLSLSTQAFANHYDGTITEVITDTGGFPFYYVGETFHGWYDYTSPTINGTFYSVFGGNGEEPNQSLNGLIFMPMPFVGIEESSLWGFIGGGDLLVSNGVPSLDWSYDEGGIFTLFNGGDFTSDSYNLEGGPDGNEPDIFVFGTITLSAPAQVPDQAPTGWLLCGAFGAGFWLYVREKRQANA
jgi:hypothetical protein